MNNFVVLSEQIRQKSTSLNSVIHSLKQFVLIDETHNAAHKHNKMCCTVYLGWTKY